MVAGRQPRWPDGTPVAPSGRGPGGGRWKGDGKPNKPRKSWAEVASDVIGHARGAVGRAMGRPQGPRDSSHDHDGNLDLDYPARMKQRGATDADLTVPKPPAKKAAPRKAAAKKAAPKYRGSMMGADETEQQYKDRRMSEIRDKYGLPEDADGNEVGEAIRYFTTGGRVGHPGRSTKKLPEKAPGGPSDKDWAERIDADMPSSSGKGRGAMSDEDLADVLSSGPGEDQAGANARAVDYLDGVHSDRLRSLRDKLATERSRGRGRIGDRSVIESLDHAIEQRGEVSEGSIARDRLAAIEEQIRAGKGKRTPIKQRVLDHLSDQQLTFAELEDLIHELEKRDRPSGGGVGAYGHRIHESLQEALRLQGSPKYRRG